MKTSAAQREAMLEFVLLAAEEDSTRPFPAPVVEALRRLVPCDTVAYRAWSPEHGVFDEAIAADDLPDRRRAWTQYPLYRRDDPHPSGPATHDGDRPPVSSAEHVATPLVLSEAIGDRRFWHTGLYFELMKPFGVRDVLKLFLPPDRTSGAAFVFDTSGPGFAESSRRLLVRLAPALSQFQRSARLRASLPNPDERLDRLTPRELTVLGRAAAGETTAEIAAAIFIGPSTVRKHLEHVYEKLDVRNRAAAAAVYTRARGSSR